MGFWRRCLTASCVAEVDGGDEGIACFAGHDATESGWYVVDGDEIIGLGHPLSRGYLREPGTPALDGCRLAVGLRAGDVAAVILTAYTIVAAGDRAGGPCARVREGDGEDEESFVLTYRPDGSTILLDLAEPVRVMRDSALLRRYRAARRRAFAAQL